jgi:hypothetical protein
MTGNVPMTRIMLVEDEEAIRELLFDVLAGDGFEIVEAGTCDAAFRLLERADLQLLLTEPLAKLCRVSVGIIHDRYDFRWNLDHLPRLR